MFLVRLDYPVNTFHPVEVCALAGTRYSYYTSRRSLIKSAKIEKKLLETEYNRRYQTLLRRGIDGIKRRRLIPSRRGPDVQFFLDFRRFYRTLSRRIPSGRRLDGVATPSPANADLPYILTVQIIRL
eukprot:sb/3475444/